MALLDILPAKPFWTYFCAFQAFWDLFLHTTQKFWHPCSIAWLRITLLNGIFCLYKRFYVLCQLSKHFFYSGDLNFKHLIKEHIWIMNFYLCDVQMPGNSLLFKPWPEYQTKSLLFKRWSEKQTKSFLLKLLYML